MSIHLARAEGPHLKSEIVEGLEAKYVATSKTPLLELVKQVGKADLIVDATGSSKMSFEAMQALGHNGVLVWTSITVARLSRKSLPTNQHRMGSR